MNHPFVNRAHFPDAPDPAQDPRAAQEHANLVHGSTLPTHGPLACIGRSHVPPQALGVIEDFVFRGLFLKDCGPNYTAHTGKQAPSLQAISQTIDRWASRWFDEQRLVQPWRAYRRYEKDSLRTRGLSEDHLPARYPPGTGNPPATYHPIGGLLSLAPTVPSTLPGPAMGGAPAAAAGQATVPQPAMGPAAGAGPPTIRHLATVVSPVMAVGPALVADPLLDRPDQT